MKRDDWKVEYPAFIELLRDRLGSEVSSVRLVDGYASLTASIWTFVARLTGDGGARAIFARSVRLAAVDVPLLRRVAVQETGVDFVRLRNLTAAADCNAPEVLDALLRLSVVVFRTLTELSGDAIAASLLTRLEGQEPDVR